MNAQTIQQNGQFSSNSAQKSEIMNSTIEINENIDEMQNSEITTNNKRIQSQIQEIRPDTIEKVIINDDLCKVSFRIFTHDQNIEILYNPVRNMFNATKLIQFALNNINKLKTPKIINNIDGISEKKERWEFPTFR